MKPNNVEIKDKTKKESGNNKEELYSKYVTEEEVKKIIDNLSPLDYEVSSPPHTGLCC